MKSRFGKTKKDAADAGESAKAAGDNTGKGAQRGCAEDSIHTKLKYITLVRGMYAFLVLCYTIVWFIRTSAGQVNDETRLILFGVGEILIFTTICCVCLLRNKFVKVLTYIGMAHDSALIGFIVLLTGLSASPFFYLFLIVPLYGGITLQRLGGIIGACIVSATMFFGLYLSAVPYEAIRTLADLPPFEHVGGNYLSYIILAAFCVGILTGQLSNLYTGVSRTLARTDAEFAHLKGIYATLLNALPIGVVIVNPDTNRVVFHNPSARELLGDDLEIPPPSESSPENPQTARASAEAEPIANGGAEPDEDAPGDSGLGFKNDPAPACRAMREIQKMQSFRNSPEDSCNEWTSYANNLYLRIVQFKLAVQQFNFVGYHIADMTAQHKAQQERARRARLEHLGEFSAKVAHEIRNPLSCISGCNEMLQYIDDDAEKAQIREMMNGEIARLNNMLNDILVFSRKPKIRMQSLNVSSVIRSQWKIFGERAWGDAMKLSCDIPDDFCIEFDDTSLRQIFMTLWQNSSEANSGKATVFVRLSGTDCIAASDSGPGICDEDAARIFEPFYTTKPSGTGLGLATARQYARDNGYSLSWSIAEKAFILARDGAAA